MLKKVLRFLSYVLVAALASGLTIFLTLRNVRATKLAALEALIQTVFIEETDAEVLEDAAASAMVRATGDEWSYYVPASYKDTFEESESNSYVGIGITISARDDGRFDIMEVVAEGPAEEAGILAGDVLTAAAGEDVTALDNDGVKKLVRGKEGTEVEITVERDGESLAFSVKRRSFETPVAQFQMMDDGVGYLHIKNFESRCAKETLAGIESLLEQGAEKLLIDVRNNPGGSAAELIKVLDYFLPEGEIFHTVDYRGKEEFFQSDANCLEIPVVVMVNGDSYSAAEFFAAALQEYGAATIVGEKTYGKGYFQYVYPLGDGSYAALSSGRYYTPSGKSLIGEGIQPDYPVEMTEEQAFYLYYGQLDAEDDPVIAKALEVLKG